MNINDLKKAYGKKVYRKVKASSITEKTIPAEYRLTFGMHKGEKLSNVPVSYLLWVVENVTSRLDVIAIVQRYLNGSQGVPPSPPPSISTATGEAPSRRSRIAKLAAKYAAPSPASPVRAERDGGKRGVPTFEHYRSLIANHYRTSKEFDIETFDERGLFLYRRCMDSCRKMRAIIESMEESPASLGMLQTIYKGMGAAFEQNAP